MYTMKYLKTFAETLDLPEASRTPLYNDYATLLAAPGAVEEMSAAENKLFDGRDIPRCFATCIWVKRAASPYPNAGGKAPGHIPVLCVPHRKGCTAKTAHPF